MALAVILAALLAGCAPAPQAPEETTVPTVPEYNTMTAEEAMQEMTIGWNLGNTFDAPEGELSWGNPMTTQEMIQTLYDLGFRTLRIPVSWHRREFRHPEPPEAGSPSRFPVRLRRPHGRTGIIQNSKC